MSVMVVLVSHINERGQIKRVILSETMVVVVIGEQA